MNEIQLQYKRETGKSTLVPFEDEVDYSEFEDVEIYDKDYVEWLEEKVESLQKEISNNQ